MKQRRLIRDILPAVFALLLLLGAAAWMYWPGIHGPAMLDDRASVAVLDVLNEHPEYAVDSVLGDRAGPLGRPVSMLSFVLEKLYFDQGLAGSKKINIVLHLLNTCLLVWLFSLLLLHIRTPQPYWLAVLAGAAWMLSPLYVSTVLYVVQRMAMLATLFMLMSSICYCYWRSAIMRGTQGWGWLLSALVALMLAVFAKENAIVLLPVLLLMEWLWFEFKGADDQILKGLRLTSVALMVIGTAFVCGYFTVGFDGLVASYRLRNFTLYERVLTETRILWDYVGQLFHPEVTRMGLYHDDVVVSRSWLEPVATLYASMAWLGLITCSVVLLTWRSGRYLVFAVAVFIIGHSTESTILPLELYFEHRNYFPGIGLFLGIAVLLGLLMQKWPEVQAPVLVWAGGAVIYLATLTSSQVLIWSNAPLLYLNYVNAHPESFRANADMAGQLANVGALSAALDYSARAHRANPNERQGDYDLRDLALSCAVNEPLPAQRIAVLGEVNPLRPLGSVSTLNVLVRQLQDNKCPNFDRLLFADRMAVLFLEDESADKAAPNIYAGLAVLENALERYDNAYQYIEKFLIGSPGNTRGLLMKLHFASALGKVGEARAIILQLQKIDEEGRMTVADRQTLALYTEK